MMNHLVALAFCLSFAVSAASAGDLWKTDYAAAAEKARAENRFLLLDFTGSDWCGWCIKLDREVFSERKFKDYAEANLVCVELDFPREKKLSKDRVEQNQALQQKYQVRGFPTILLLDPDGNKVAQTGYREGGAKAYVEHLESLIAPARKGPVRSAAAPAPAPGGRTALRTWTAKSGATVEAALIEYGGGIVLLRKADGHQVSIRDTQLSDPDLALLAGR